MREHLHLIQLIFVTRLTVSRLFYLIRRMSTEYEEFDLEGERTEPIPVQIAHGNGQL